MAADDPSIPAWSRNGAPPVGGTGRLLVTLRAVGAAGAAERAVREVAGLRLARSGELRPPPGGTPAGADGVLFERLGVAVVSADRAQAAALFASGSRRDGTILAVEPEEYLMALGRRSDGLPDAGGSDERPEGGALGILGGASGAGGWPQPDLQSMTWGVQVTQAWRSPAGGAGIRIAVLDTGFDLGHPDFAGRDIASESFVPGSPVQDVHGHGTHTAGTACGPRLPAGTAKRYGVACDATLLVGKVLDDFGYCQEGWLLAGLDWALRQRADIVSMSLGWHVGAGEPFKQALEQAGRAALDANCVLVAAAGNDGRAPVFRPANCPSIFAVGALDDTLDRARFSCIGLNGDGGELDLAAPGVDVYSSAPMPDRYQRMEGTSMATPHVAGCAALWAENHGLRGRALWAKMLQWTRPVAGPRSDVGAGLVQAPW